MLVNDGQWPATCLSLFDCQREPAIGFHQGLKTSVQQSILLNFQGCQQHDQMCIKNQSAEYIFNQEMEVSLSYFLPFLFSFFFSFPFLLFGQIDSEDFLRAKRLNLMS